MLIQAPLAGLIFGLYIFSLTYIWQAQENWPEKLFGPVPAIIGNHPIIATIVGGIVAFVLLVVHIYRWNFK